MQLKISTKNQKKQFSLLIKNAKERIESAEILFKKGFYNDSISRAYYAFFDTANALLITKGLFAKTHSGVITLFSLHFIKTKLIPIEYISLFRRAKDAREQADYEVFKKFTKRDAQQIIRTAKDFVNFVNKNFKQ